MNITRNYDGSYTAATVYDGYRIHMLYIGCSISQVKKRFTMYLKTLKQVKK